MSLRETVARRELLWNLTLRELRTRYRRSALGWAWSLLNPLATMAIFSMVFLVIFDAPSPVGDPSGLKNYPLYLMCGLLPWTFFNLTVSVGMQSIVGNAGLVKKVAFPQEVLVVSTSGSLLVSLGIEMSLLLVVLLIAGNMVIPWILPLVVVLLLLAVFSVGLALVFAAANVFYRDVGYLWSIAGQAWFYLTPVIWSVDQVPSWMVTLASWQPMGSFVIAIRNLTYDLRWPTAARWLHLSGVAIVMLGFGLWVFSKLSPRFAEEL